MKATIAEIAKKKLSRLLICVAEMEREFLGTRAFISILALFLVVGSWFMSLGFNFRDKSVSHFDDLIFALGITSAFFFGVVVIPVTEVIASLVMPTFPIFVAPSLKAWGLIPDNGWSPLLWQAICSPLELFVGSLAGVSGSLATEMLISAVGVIKIYLREMETKVVNGSLTTLEKRYTCLELYNRVLIEWLKFAYPPMLFSLITCVIITAFVAIRHTELPIFIHASVMLAGTTLTAIIFALTIQGALIRNSSVRMMRLLRLHPMGQNCIATTAEQKFQRKKVKAFRPVSLPIGQFGEMSVGSVNAICEGILNQLIFLLSL